MPDQLEQNAARFMAIGNPLRLSILRLLVQGQGNGTSVGAILERVGIPGSTLSHHLSRLAEAGLVIIERDGTTLRYRPDFRTLKELTFYLWESCCGGDSAGQMEEAGPGCCPPRKPGR